MPLIVSLVSFLAIKKAGAEKKTRSVKEFTVKCPRAFKQIFLVLALMPAMMGLLLLLSFGVGEEVESGVYIVMSAISGSILFVLLVATLQRLDVENDILTYRNFLGWEKRISYDQIDKAVFTNQFLVLYAKGKSVGSLSRDCLHVDNFYKYCEEKGIPIQYRSKRPIDYKEQLVTRRWEKPEKKRNWKDGIIGIFFGFLVILGTLGVHAPELLTERAAPGTMMFFLQLAIVFAGIFMGALLLITILGSRKHYKNKRAELEEAQKEKADEMNDHAE